MAVFPLCKNVWHIIDAEKYVFYPEKSSNDHEEKLNLLKQKWRQFAESSIKKLKEKGRALEK